MESSPWLRRRVKSAIAALAIGAPVLGCPVAGATQFDEDDAWSDEHTIGRYQTVSRGDVVRMWQQYLWSEGGWISACDGVFGGNTAGVTQWWQQSRGLTADGVVGTATWFYARAQVTFFSNAGNGVTYHELYHAGAPSLKFVRDSKAGGTWKWEGWNSGGSYYSTNHPGITSGAAC